MEVILHLVKHFSECAREKNHGLQAILFCNNLATYSSDIIKAIFIDNKIFLHCFLSRTAESL